MKRLAKRVFINGEWFDSAGEYERWCELQRLFRCQVIHSLRRQVKFPLSIEGRPLKIRSPRYKNGRSCVYTADFVYEEDGEIIVEDFKGFHTDASRLRMAVFEAQYDKLIRLTGPQRMRKRKSLTVSPDVAA